MLIKFRAGPLLIAFLSKWLFTKTESPISEFPILQKPSPDSESLTTTSVLSGANLQKNNLTMVRNIQTQTMWSPLHLTVLTSNNVMLMQVVINSILKYNMTHSEFNNGQMGNCLSRSIIKTLSSLSRALKP